ncbi:MAG: four helix bundle protein [bacterium]
MFRFEKLDVWQRGIEISDGLLDLADALSERNLYRFAEQLRRATLSITNNIAEGSGAATTTELKQFLGYSRRSVFEVVNMLFIFERREYISQKELSDQNEGLEELSKMITGFTKKL